MDDNWWFWLAVFILIGIGQAWRALFRSVNKSGGGMARLNAAAERILKERGASAANPVPRAQAAATKAAERMERAGSASPKPRSPALLPKSTTPAVIRRHGLLAAGREPVVQRRR